MTIQRSKIPVLFVTPIVFGSANNGPATYMHYLWDSFSEHESFDFNVVTPQSDNSSDKIHSSGLFSSSRKQYQTLQSRALELASQYQTPPIIHGNTAHTMWCFHDYDGPVVAQINDYDAANIFQTSLHVIRRYGVRRFLSLAWRHKMESHAASFLTRIICNSEFTRNQVAKRYPSTDSLRLQVIYKAVDLSMFGPDENQTSFPLPLIGERRILFVGCNWYRKGLDVAIQALASLSDEYRNVSLIVAGNCSNSKSDQRIRALPEKLGISQRVQFLGVVKRDKIASLYKACDLFLLPSRQEALGVAILEAVSSGLPVIATKTGGIPEILKNCEGSVLVAPESVDQLANSLVTILSRSTMESADVSALENFTKRNMIQQIEMLYRDLDRSR